MLVPVQPWEYEQGLFTIHNKDDDVRARQNDFAVFKVCFLIFSQTGMFKQIS